MRKGLFDFSNLVIFIHLFIILAIVDIEKNDNDKEIIFNWGEKYYRKLSAAVF